MIPRADITAWRAQAPWATDAQVEQDLVICRALSAIYKDRFLAPMLAFRGGTALNKILFVSPLRYSEDIDLVQVDAGPIGPIMKALRGALAPWLGEPGWKRNHGRTTLLFRFESETRPIVPLKLKVEVNTREHFCALGMQRRQLSIVNPWYTGSAELLTYAPEELLGTKLRALYQRKKGRDLFDLSEALERLPALDPDAVIHCFLRYLAHEGQCVTRAQFETNLKAKLCDSRFIADVPPLLRSGIPFDAGCAGERVLRLLVSRLP